MPRISTPIALVSTSTLTFDLKTLGGELASTHTCNHRTGVIRAFNHEPACGTSTTGRKRESLRRQSSVARATARTLAPKEEDLRLMRQGQGNAHEPFLRWQGAAITRLVHCYGHLLAALSISAAFLSSPSVLHGDVCNACNVCYVWHRACTARRSHLQAHGSATVICWRSLCISSHR
jgi:hypothetical protein